MLTDAKRRSRQLNDLTIQKRGHVIYHMSRDQRVHDNYALKFAQEEAIRLKVPLIVVFCLSPKFLGATMRQYHFMIEGLKQLERELRLYNIDFVLLVDQNIPNKLVNYAKETNASLVVKDFSPLNIHKQWSRKIVSELEIPIYEVDTHNIIPCWITSTKQEYAAYTIRKKIHRLLPDFLTEISQIERHPYRKGSLRMNRVNWEEIYKHLSVDMTVEPVNWIKPGESSAIAALIDFIVNRLAKYDELRNDPNKGYQSNLSPYLHFGQLSSQRVALEVEKSDAPISAQEAYLEELIVRKELSDNFCYYNNQYDEVDGFPNWASQTLNEHLMDEREYIYTQDEIEKGKTHDDLFNAAQHEMVLSGKMHGFMRMYWAKKLLEWSNTPDIAMKTAIYLNDRYSLDGRDPNGYAGIAWSIGGVHDRAWRERSIFGKVRYMNFNGCKRKFEVNDYIQTWKDDI